jgi:hypothetical protein
LFGGLFVEGVPFNILIIASPDVDFAVVFFAVAFVAGFLPLVEVVFLVVAFFGLAMICSFSFYCCLLMQTL